MLARHATIFISGLVAAVSLACLTACRQRAASPPQLRAQLIAALATHRPIEGRLSGFPYAPLGSLAHPPAAPGPRFRNELGRLSSPQALAAQAIFLLQTPVRVDRAITLLERATAAAPRDPVVANDLAAAYLDRGGRDGTQDLFRALSTARAAAELAPGRIEVKFNLALALERLSQSADAGQVWRDFLAADARSGWADEARAHLREIERRSLADNWEPARNAIATAVLAGDRVSLRRIIDSHRLRARSYVELTLLRCWAESMQAGRLNEARSALAEAREIGNVYAELSGDSMLRDAIATIDKAASFNRRLARLARGHAEFALGMESYQHFDRPQAAAHFASAKRQLESGASPFWSWAALFAAACDYKGNRYDETLAELDALERRTNLPRFPNLAGRAAWIRGLIQAIREQPLAARQSYRVALSHFERTGELGFQAVVHGLLFDVDDFLGDESQAWQELGRCLALASDLEDKRSLQLVALFAAQAALAAELPQAALHFQNQSVHLALASGNAIQTAIALRDRASFDVFASRQTDVERDVVAAKEWARRSKDEALQAEVLLLEARLLGVRSTDRALAALASALPVIVRTQDVRLVASAYLLRGRLFARAGNRPAAEADFEAGIAQVERTFGGLDDPSRLAFLDRSSELFDEMIGLQSTHEAQPWPTAFAYTERARGRALTKLLEELKASRSPLARGLTEMQRRVPADQVLVEFAVLQDRILAWVLTGTLARTVTLRIGSAELRQRAQGLISAVLQGESVSDDGKALYRILIAPLALPRSTVLVLATDKSLNDLPFGALRNPASGRYLIEEHPLVLTPSASVYLSPVTRSKAQRQATVPALVVVDPAFDSSFVGDLPRLPRAVAEGAEIANLYGAADLLTGVTATKARVLAAIGSHRVVHLGVHGQVDGRSPLFSRLILAPDSKDRGILLARDLYGRTFSNTELVVLAACGSAAGPVADSEGVASLARPFLAAGVPGVIGSLWLIEDSAAERLSIELHRAMASGATPASALRTAELTLLHSATPSLREPRSWAGFVLYATSAAPTVPPAESGLSREIGHP
jgi:CHAT domain-containing protein